MGKRINVMDGMSVKIQDALTFLIGQLEYLDPIIKDPLHAESYAKYLPIKSDAGWVESTSFISANAKGSEQRLGGTGSNAIRRIGADLVKTPTPVDEYKAANDYGVDELYKASKAGINLDDLYYKMLRIDYEKYVDRIAFVGFANKSIPGLLQGRTGVFTYNVPNGAALSPLWANKTPLEILVDINAIIMNVRQRTGYSQFPNLILVDELNFAYIATTMINALGNRSILDYVLENNAARKAGINLIIAPSKWCAPQVVDGVTVGGNVAHTGNRMCAYINDSAFTRFHLPVPLTREDVTKIDLRISVPFIAQIGGVEIIYNESIAYADGI